MRTNPHDDLRARSGPFALPTSVSRAACLNTYQVEQVTRTSHPSRRNVEPATPSCLLVRVSRPLGTLRSGATSYLSCSTFSRLSKRADEGGNVDLLQVLLALYPQTGLSSLSFNNLARSTIISSWKGLRPRCREVCAVCHATPRAPRNRARADVRPVRVGSYTALVSRRPRFMRVAATDQDDNPRYSLLWSSGPTHAHPNEWPLDLHRRQNGAMMSG